MARQVLLITGARGFIGKQCLMQLAESDFEIHAIASQAFSNEKDLLNAFMPKKLIDTINIHWHLCNIFDDKALKELFAKVKPTHLLHLAWDTTPGQYLTTMENLNWLASSTHLVRYFIENGGQRSVLSGTCAEYDWRYGYCDEVLTPLRSKTLYSACKVALHAVHEQMTTKAQISSAWARPFFLYGPYEHEKRLIPYVINALLDDKEAQCSHGMQIRDFLHVSDVAQGFVRLLSSEQTGDFNLGSGSAPSVRHIVETIAQKLNRTHLIKFAARTPNDNEDALLVAKNARLSNEIGWKARYAKLEEGLHDTIEWWQAHRVIRG